MTTRIRRKVVRKAGAALALLLLLAVVFVMPDDWETQYGFDPDNASDGAQDADNDGVDNAREYRFGTDPFLADTDGDGLSDGDEIDLYSSSPRSSDTDEDGLSDAEEIQVHGTDPTNADSDDDGLSDLEEITNYQTDPMNADSDNDGVDDLAEIRLLTDPNDAASVPQQLDFYEESFEGAQPPVEWYRPADAQAGWTPVAGNAPHRSQWLESQPIGDNETAAIEFVGYFGDGIFAFESRVDAESCCDSLRVYVDDNLVVHHANETPARYSYRLNEDREEGTVYAYYGFALKDVDHLQIAIYVDREADLANAELLFNSVR